MRKSSILFGRSATYSVAISPQAEKMVRTLLHAGMNGNNINAAIERLVASWIVHHGKELEVFDLSYDRAGKEGYVPFSLRNQEEDRSSENKSKGKYQVSFYGLGAYVVDRLAQTGLYGKQPEEVIERILYRSLEEHIREGEITKARSRRVYVCTPATATEIRRKLGITKKIQENVDRVFKKTSVKV